MDSISDPPNLPHIMRVYPIVTNAKIQTPQVLHISHPALQSASQGKISYQQTITDTISVSEQEENQIQSQIIMSCQQTHLQSIQPLTNVSMQSQVLTSDISQLQFTSHVILPQVPVYKQQMIVDSQQHYYGHYEVIQKDQHCVLNEVETENVESSATKQLEDKPETIPANGAGNVKVQTRKRTRNPFPNPNKWACNVRKLKHQRGEAYISRRGSFVPERKIRNTKNCLTSCRFKCNQRISDADRELIFKAFYSLNANEKKHFLLNTTERHNVKNAKTGIRQYTFKYFFLVRAVRYTVCKNFYLGTLAISQKPVYNVHLGKSEMNLPKPDGRGLSVNSVHALPSESKERVRRHIASFKTVDSKQITLKSRKKQYFGANVTIKRMYEMYLDECSKDNIEPVRESMYRKIVRQDFNVHFKKTKADQLCAKCKEPIKDK